MFNSTFYHSNQSSRPFRRSSDSSPMSQRNSWHPPKAPQKVASCRHFDDETPSSAIQKTQSERSIFGAASGRTVIHIPRHKPKRNSRISHPHRRIHGMLETTTKEPWDPVRSEDPVSKPEHTMAVKNTLIRGHGNAKSDALKWVENWDQSNAMQQNAPDHRTGRTQRVEHGPIHPHHVVADTYYYAASHPQLPTYHPPYYHSTTCTPSTSPSSSISFHSHQRRISTGSFECRRTDVMVDDLHRRASTISDTNVTASTADISRRFSDGSSLVSSQSTAASSVIIEEDEEQQTDHKDGKGQDDKIPVEEVAETKKEEQEDEKESKEHKDAKLTTLPIPCASTTVEEEEQKQEKEEQDEIPIWADPVRIRENPIRYQYVRDYMKRQGLSTQSPLPLPSTYTFYFSETQAAKHQKIATANYMSSVKTMFHCETVWDFASRWRQYKAQVNRPSQMQPNQNLYCFLKDVAPMWEDPRNKNGGRLTICPPRAQLDDVFDWVLSSFVGGNMTDEGAVGVVLSRRSRGDRVELWLDETASSSAVAKLKDKLQGYVPVHLQEIVGSGRFKKHYDK